MTYFEAIEFVAGSSVSSRWQYCQTYKIHSARSHEEAKLTYICSRIDPLFQTLLIYCKQTKFTLRFDML